MDTAATFIRIPTPLIIFRHQKSYKMTLSEDNNNAEILEETTTVQLQPSSPTPSNSSSTSTTKKEKDSTSGSSSSSNSSIVGGKSAKNVPSSTPAINIFSNDGSFLDRFKKMKAEEDEKKKQLEALERKKAFEERIKNRGKRKIQPTDEEPDAKRVILEENEREEALDPKANAYLKEMQKYNERLCKDDAGHVRPLVK